MEVMTNGYRDSHGRALRGHGWWAFTEGDNRGRYLTGRDDKPLGSVGEAKFWEGTFTEAKRAATAFAKRHGLRRIGAAS